LLNVVSGKSKQVSEDAGAAAVRRQQNLYFNELFQLKVQCEYMRRYRDTLSGRIRWLATIRAVASSGAIAGWAIIQAHPMAWATVIAAAQVADVLKDVFPFTARHKAVSGLVTSLEAQVIEALFEYEGVAAERFTNEEITERRRTLMKVRHEAEAEHLSTGDLPIKAKLLALAEEDAVAYFETMFGPYEKM
jgi:hypothetical protein